MEKLTKESIAEVVQTSEHPSVTIYVPMHTTASPPHISENQIRLKNLITRAADQLDTIKDHGTSRNLSRQLREFADARYNDWDFWEKQTPGLLICANANFIRIFNLPIDTEEYVAVDEQFHLAPVLALLEDVKEFYVLTLAQHNPKLLKGDAYGLQDTDIALPISLEEGLGIDENNQKSENQGSARGLSTETGWFNGRGGARNPQEEDRMRFFRMIDETISNTAERNLPLVLAGIDAEIAEYRGISKYPKLTQQHIAGNHTETDLSTLFARAVEIIRNEMVEPEHQAAVDEYARMKGTNPSRITADQENITDAAQQGRIDKLLTSLYRNTTDTVRDTLSAVLRITFPETDLAARQLNAIALSVWNTSGKIISLQPEQIPDNKPMVARLRY